MQWYLEVLKKYAVFEGRARRKEYWMFFLFNVLAHIVLAIIDNVSGLSKATNGVNPLDTLYSLAVLIPSIAVTVRRLHDTGRSGFWIFIAFIPCVGALLLLVWMVTEGTKGPNEFGPDPKEFAVE